jgi:hypothetical protein
VRSFTVATPQRISLGGANQGEPDKQDLYRDPDINSVSMFNV